MRLLAVFAAGLLLGVSSGLVARHYLAALADAAAIGNVACTAAQGNWTDCTLTLNEAISPGGMVVASLPTGTDIGGSCDDGAPLASLCALSGSSAVFICPEGCLAGTVFADSILGMTVRPTRLAQMVTVTMAASMGRGG